ncbi:phosphatase PAP2 family protein [Pontibacter locisalis]|uniref:Phosphatase PAP2 family protein n=1 Tax=Pontibacter locisalis TaxID=1719035 RepID=A0ABW5IH17_9BACT
MKHIFTLFSAVLIFAQGAFAQTESPYKTRLAVDGPIIVTGMGLSYYGLTLMQDKDGLTEEEIANLSKDDVNGFDRFSAGWDSESAKKVSDIPFYGSFALPFALMLKDEVGKNAGQIFVLYVETMAVTGSLFTMTNGLAPRTRPLIYSDDVEMSEKTRANARNSFYAGHTAAAASATFFAAKVFHDFYPDSNARPYVWAAAAAIPATVGYLRLRAGKHFLSDNILGYTLGAAAGILVPQLHKKSNKTNISLVPITAPSFRGALLTYRF